MTTERTYAEFVWQRHLELLQRAQERGDIAALAILHGQDESLAERVRTEQYEGMSEGEKRYAVGDR